MFKNTIYSTKTSPKNKENKSSMPWDEGWQKGSGGNQTG